MKPTANIALTYEAIRMYYWKILDEVQLFPQGLVYDYENHRFGTSEISTFYRVLPTKKDSEEPSKSFLVAGVGFEPTTFWL